MSSICRAFPNYLGVLIELERASMRSTGSHGKRLGAATLLTPLLVLVALTGGSPTRVFAQAVKPADLVGAWARQGETKISFTFLADSTVTFPVSAQAGQQRVEATAKGRWRLAGDTLIISGVRANVMGRPVLGNYPMDPRLVTFKDKLLTLTRLTLTLPNGTKDTSAAAAASAIRVYQRVPQDTQPAAKP